MESSEKSVRCLERGLDLLAAMERAGKPVSVAELSAATSIPKGTTLRLLNVLERRRYAEKNRGRYQLGTAVVPLSRSFLSGNRLVVAASSIMEQLSVASGESVALHVRDGFSRVVIHRVEGSHPLRYAIPIGQRFPLLVGSASVVLAAAMPGEELTRMLEEMPTEVRLASGSLLTREEYLVRLEAARQQGYAVAADERVEGVVSVSAPVVDGAGRAVAALTVVGPSSRITPDRLEHLRIEVPRSSREVGERYAYTYG